MHILIIGSNRVNDHVSEYFTQKGMNVSSVPDVYRLRSVIGEVGSFRVDTKEESDTEDLHFTGIDFIILTEQPTAQPVEIAGLPAFTLYEDKEYAISAGAALSEPVVFLLDFICESPMSATICALSDAIVFAQKKRKVFYLSKFVRTAGRGIETLYREAREAGVTFIKYEDLKVTADLDKEEFSIVVSDGEIDLDVKTKTVYADGGRDVGESFSYAVKKLNLTSDKHGYLTVDKYYLTPALTSRRGVYHIPRDLAAERLEEGLDFIYAAAMNSIKDTPPFEIPSHGTAVIDGKKCVFCYNCYRACPHAALEPDPTECRMKCLSAACAGCGVCAGICPANAISLENINGWTDDEPGKTLVICCENSGGASIEESKGISVLAIPCGGLIETGRLSYELYLYEKVMVVVCPDDACRHFDGNKRACAQVKHLHDMLEAAGLSSDKVRIIQASQAMPVIMTEELERFLEEFHDYC